MTLEAIKSAIPHREPFLLIDEIVEQTDNRIVCRKRFTGDEFWYRGPLSGVSAHAGRAAVRGGDAGRRGAAWRSIVADNPDSVPVVTRMNNVKFKAMVRPGDTVELDVELTEQLAGRVFHGRQGHWSTARRPSRSTSPAKWPSDRIKN